LLLEPKRSNVITYSNDFSQSAWNKSGTSVVSGFTSPYKTENAFKLVESTSNEAHTITSSTGTVISGATTTKSIIVKPNGRRWIVLLDIHKPSSRTWFDLELGVVGSLQPSAISSKIEKLSNGYFRCSSTSAVNGTSSKLRMDIVQGDNITTGYQGDGTSGVYIYNAQLEVGSYATSYIPTSGQANGVTRVAEDFNCTLPDTDSFNSSTGFSVITKFGIGTAGSGTSSPFMYFSDDNASTFIGFGSTGSNFRCRLNLNGTAYLNTQGNALRTQENSLFVSCDSNGWSQGANGVTNYTGNNDASVYDKLSTIIYAPSEIYGIIRIKELSVYNTRLSNAELQALTQ
jgi:hypothetical protein